VNKPITSASKSTTTQPLEEIAELKRIEPAHEGKNLSQGGHSIFRRKKAFFGDDG